MALNKDNNFLQSDVWRQFQEAVGRKTFIIKEGPARNASHSDAGGDIGFSASIIEHELPIVGKYFYVPRGPIMEHGTWNMEQKNGFDKLFNLAKENKANWIRIDPEDDRALELIKDNISLPIKKAPHNMQPREVLVMDISKSEEELLSGMKSKTRYNINLAQKRGVAVKTMSNDKFPMTNQISNPNGKDKKYHIDKFVELVKLTAKRKGVNFHPENYYRKMLEIIPNDILKLYVAEYEHKVIAANLVIFYGDTATYLHGATDGEYRNVMAPYLLQWQAIKDAKKAGCLQYDFGGVKRISPLPLTPSPGGRGWLEKPGEGNWSGITKFKLGFAPTTEPINFPGSFDLVINAPKYFTYQIFSQLRNIFSSIGR